MNWLNLAPIAFIIIFWAFIFVFAFWMSVRALRAPTEAELEYEATEGEHAPLTPAH